jgi:hypothetical protein
MKAWLLSLSGEQLWLLAGALGAFVAGLVERR